MKQVSINGKTASEYGLVLHEAILKDLTRTKDYNIKLDKAEIRIIVEALGLLQDKYSLKTKRYTSRSTKAIAMCGYIHIIRTNLKYIIEPLLKETI